MKHIYSLLIITIFAISCSSCKKSTPDPVSQLPSETQTGANTFGCLVNGVAMMPKEGKPSIGNPYYTPAVQVIFADEVRIEATGDGTNSTYSCFYIYNVYVSGNAIYTWKNATYGVQYYPYHSEIYGVFLNPKTKKLEWYGSYDSSGSITVTKFDQTSRILSGTFSGKLVTRDTHTDTINVTNGRLDLKW